MQDSSYTIHNSWPKETYLPLVFPGLYAPNPVLLQVSLPFPTGQQ